MSPTLIRPMLPADAAPVAGVNSAAWRVAYRDLLPARELTRLEPAPLTRRWQQRLDRQQPGEHSLVGLLDDEVQGYASLGPCRDTDLGPGFAGEVYELYVHPEAWGRGLGAALLDAAWKQLEADARHWGVLWVLERNHRARAFYEARGMQEDGHRKCWTIAVRRWPTLRYARPLNMLALFAG